MRSKVERMSDTAIRVKNPLSSKVHLYSFEKGDADTALAAIDFALEGHEANEPWAPKPGDPVVWVANDRGYVVLIDDKLDPDERRIATAAHTPIVVHVSQLRKP